MGANVNADNTKVQVALDDTFQNTVVDTLVRQNSLSLSKLDSNTNYYWRIQESNNCGISSFSEPFNFSTTVISCLEVTSSAIPKNIQDAEDNVSKGVTTSSINVNYDLAIQDLDIYVDIEHTYLEDLTLYLESPEGIIPSLLVNWVGTKMIIQKRFSMKRQLYRLIKGLLLLQEDFLPRRV